MHIMDNSRYEYEYKVLIILVCYGIIVNIVILIQFSTTMDLYY